MTAFQRVEGMPLYRYQLRLRLTRALDLLAQYDDARSARAAAKDFDSARSRCMACE